MRFSVPGQRPDARCYCYEEGLLSLPYLAFVEAMRSYVFSREIKDLREELGTVGRLHYY